MFRSLRSDSAPKITLTINGQAVTAAAGQSVWSAMVLCGQPVTRRAALSGQDRSAYCAMGVCFECMVVIDGFPNQQACLRQVAEGMTVATQTITEDRGAPDAGL
ncbi:sarcosine oxidase [Leisingera sp. ANG-M1]|uniref:(2Fe-2S)-binding protein n=1 Tax=Leisingera sp. ANG-M1 TaxID=1577895 RepID=UPI00057D7A01|nr:(2Fe-2S)-binding protein [Leisingera sp. ANG-M1]KIC09265.1 sarcosine oxidase [Leisingera sp. ANG-M1]